MKPLFVSALLCFPPRWAEWGTRSLPRVIRRIAFAASILVAASLGTTSTALAQQCAGGRVVTPATEGRCCWPGQVFSVQTGRCQGPPQCPPGLAAAGDDCVPATTGTWEPAQSTHGGTAPPPAPMTVRRPIWGLVVAGAITLGVAWLATPIVGAAIEADGEEIAMLAAPVAGPWICMGACYDPDDYTAALVVSGLLQLSGLTMLILGLAIQQKVEVRAELDDGVQLAARPWALPSPTPAGGFVLELSNF